MVARSVTPAEFNRGHIKSVTSASMNVSGVVESIAGSGKISREWLAFCKTGAHINYRHGRMRSTTHMAMMSLAVACVSIPLCMSFSCDRQKKASVARRAWARAGCATARSRT